MNARALGYHPVIDEDAIKPVRDHFTAIARQEKLPVGKPLEYDASHPLHQVPGGMISNFRFQLSNLGKSCTSGRAGGLPFAGPSKGPTRKRVKFTLKQISDPTSCHETLSII